MVSQPGIFEVASSKTATAVRRRTPNYKSGVRMTRIAVELFDRPLGWSFDSIQRELGINERTLQRYLETFKRGLVDRNGRSLLEAFTRGDKRLLRLARHGQAPDSNAYNAASLFFMLTILRFLDGTILKQGIDDLWERLRDALPLGQRDLLGDVERKFFAVAIAAKDYKAFDDQLDFILRGLLQQRRLEIEYQAVGQHGRIAYSFEPFTLIAYKGGLYLAGRNSKDGRVLYLAIERMGRVGFAQQNGTADRFIMPASWRPERYTEGVFGIVDGPETDVQLLVRNEATETYLRSRSIHPTQKFHRRPDGKAVLTMKVRGTDELRNWILGFGPWLKVLKPRELRDEVHSLLAEGAALYRQSVH